MKDIHPHSDVAMTAHCCSGAYTGDHNVSLYFTTSFSIFCIWALCPGESQRSAKQLRSIWWD